MCGHAFLKGVVVFCLTFGLGAFVSSLFVQKEQPAKREFCPMAVKETPLEKEVSMPKATNCVPVDDFKYGNLTLKRKGFYAELAPKSEPGRSDLKKELTASRVKPHNFLKPEARKFELSKDPTEYEVLIHKEQCFANEKRQ